MKAVVRKVLWKADAMLEMNRSRYSGLGEEVVVVSGSEWADIVNRLGGLGSREWL